MPAINPVNRHEERNIKGSAGELDPTVPTPAYLLDREDATSAKALSSQIKNKSTEFLSAFGIRAVLT